MGKGHMRFKDKKPRSNRVAENVMISGEIYEQPDDRIEPARPHNGMCAGHEPPE